MRAWISIIGVAAIATALVLCRAEPAGTPETPEDTAASMKAQAPETRARANDTPGSDSVSLARPELFATGPITLRREPQQPGEDDSEYRRRNEFVTAFDWFRTQSRIAADKERQILRILGSLQENLHAIEAEGDEATREAVDYGLRRRLNEHLAWGPEIAVESAFEAEEQIARMLTPSERAAWQRYVADLVRGVHLQYASPLRVEPDSAAGR